MFADMSVNMPALRRGRARTPEAVRRGSLAARLARLYLGLGGFGVSLALMVRARLGPGPWDVLHLCITGHLGVQLGGVTMRAGQLALLAWVPFRQRPRLGMVID